jgi:hypothetical protein
MRVLRRKQEEIAGFVFEYVFIDAMRAIAIDDINQLKKIMLVGGFWTLIGFLVYDLEGLIKILRIHACKSTETARNGTDVCFLQLIL